MKEIFSDCEILSLEKDSKEPGVFVKVKKPEIFVEKDLSDYELYSIVVNKRVKEIKNKDFDTFYFWKISNKYKLKKLFFNFGKFAYNKV
jgi:hypothetical protein